MILDKFRVFYKNVVDIISNPENEFYLWGAGVVGEYILEMFDRENFLFKGVLDSRKEKQGKKFCGFSVLDPKEVIWKSNTKVILASLDYPEGMEQYLQSLGKKENYDYFFSNIFLSVYMMKWHKKLYLHHVNINITDRCTLRCRDCSLFIPYYLEKKQYPIQLVLAGVDKLFNVTNYIQEVHLIGGEPLLYPDLPELISEIGRKYRNSIGEFAIATNGTVVPSKELCQAAKKNNVFFTISDYTGSPAFSGNVDIPYLLQYLKEEEISFRIGNKAIWYDFNTSGQHSMSGASEEYSGKFRKCFFRNRGLYLDQIYYCQHQYGAMRAGFNENDPEGYITLSEQLDKMELLQFELGFVPRGYLLQCQECNGFERLNCNVIDAAAQLDFVNGKRK